METAPPGEGKRAAFGTVSLVFAALTVLLPIAVALLTGYKINHIDPDNKHSGWEGLIFILLGVMAAIAVAGISSLVGTLSGIIALARGEGQAWRPVIGLIVNGPVTLFVLYLVAVWANSN